MIYINADIYKHKVVNISISVIICTNMLIFHLIRKFSLPFTIALGKVINSQIHLYRYYRNLQLQLSIQFGQCEHVREASSRKNKIVTISLIQYKEIRQLCSSRSDGKKSQERMLLFIF